ncbi:hypothetical protein PVK06_011035 [Gossypium arboreum]|uniref:Uncharacterized protein n=1 Tax=Gossypium arboreum TaxID=29729 RepID=A0ABR0Q7Z5_GOSAR|nr:hypothetical protein PVK06_011035 [Gossypium arboreum]
MKLSLLINPMSSLKKLSKIKLAQPSYSYVKPYSYRIDHLKIPPNYQPHTFQQLDGKRNPCQYVAHFVDTYNNIRTNGDLMAHHSLKKSILLLALLTFPYKALHELPVKLALFELPDTARLNFLRYGYPELLVTWLFVSFLIGSS